MRRLTLTFSLVLGLIAPLVPAGAAGAGTFVPNPVFPADCATAAASAAGVPAGLRPCTPKR